MHSPYFFSFDQFRAALHGGRLGDVKNALPPRPTTAAEAQARRDPARLQAIRAALREVDDRWYFDQAVKAGYVVEPTIEPDIKKELDDLVPDPKEKRKQMAKHGTLDSLKREKVNEDILDPEMQKINVEDAALDYVENGIGRFYLKRHWAKHRDPVKLAHWLAFHNYDVPVADVIVELDRLAQAGPWTS